MRITIILAILTFSLTLLGSCNMAYAQVQAASTSSASMSIKDLISKTENPGAVNLGESLIHPASPLYFLKAIRERIEVALDSNSEVKSMRQVEFAQRRLREVASLIKVKRQDLIPPTLEQYKLNLQIIESQIHQDEELQVRVGEAISRQLDVLARLYDSVGNPTAKAAIRAALVRAQEHNQMLMVKLSTKEQQALIGKISQRQAFACNFLMREATSSALNDSEKADLEQKVAKCQNDVGTNLKDQLEELLR